MSNYTQANNRKLHTHLSDTDYWDMHINEDNLGSFSFTGMELDEPCLASYIDTTNEECIGENELVSLPDYTWVNACSFGLQLDNIGFTGIDNGLITYQKDRITNEEFLEIFTDSHYTLPEDDLRLHLHMVSGNTKVFEYPISQNEDGSIKCNGGFYQGFFRSNKNYSILPSNINSEWVFEFEIKPEDYAPESDKTLNDKYPENKGIFFYIGIRAENKWVELYNGEHIVESPCVCDEDEGFDDEFLEDELDLSQVKVTTKDGFDLDSANDDKIISDNKFLMFDRTPSGLTANNCVGDEEILLMYKKHKSPLNLFLFLNHTPTGYTVANVDELTGEYENTYHSFYKDLYENALAFKVNEDGSIGYKYLVKDCESQNEGFWSIKEGNSYPNMVKPSEWSKITVKIKASEEYMRIFFYVNNKLKYITTELPKLNLHDMDELDEKEEGVAFNISLGGGTQGLADVVFLDYMNEPLHVYPLEKSFGGTFIGDIKSFKFYSCS